MLLRNLAAANNADSYGVAHSSYAGRCFRPSSRRRFIKLTDGFSKTVTSRTYRTLPSLDLSLRRTGNGPGTFLRWVHEIMGLMPRLTPHLREVVQRHGEVRGKKNGSLNQRRECDDKSKSGMATTQDPHHSRKTARHALVVAPSTRGREGNSSSFRRTDEGTQTSSARKTDPLPEVAARNRALPGDEGKLDGHLGSRPLINVNSPATFWSPGNFRLRFLVAYFLRRLIRIPIALRPKPRSAEGPGTELQKSR